MQGESEPKDKELQQISQQLLECPFPLRFLMEFLSEGLPGKVSPIQTKALKDTFDFTIFLQNYMHQLKLENTVQTTEGQSAVVVSKKSKASDTLTSVLL